MESEDSELILNFESDGFTNVDIKHEQDILTLNTNVSTKEEFKKWLEVLCNKNKLCFNVYKSHPVGERKILNKKYICLHGVKHKGVKKTSTGCRVFLHVVIKKVHKRSPEHIRQFPCSVEIQGHHNHPLEVAESLNQLRVSTTTKEIFVKYFEQGMTPTQAHWHHVRKMDLCNDLYGQADHTFNPSRRSVQYMWEAWRKQEHGGLNTISMFEAIEKYAQANPDIIVKVEHSGNSFCIVLITPFMMRAHKELKEAAEVVFVDATGCVDQLNTAVIPFLCAGPAGAVPLALMFTSSQAEATLTKGFGMIKEALGDSAFYGKGNPQCFITDNCEAERKALATTWPTTMLFLCIFHILQQVWRWLLDAKHGIHKEHRKELMHMMKSLVYATSRDEFSALWSEVETSPLLEQYSNFRSYLTILVQRREEWAIAFRAGVMLRGHHTNNFAESTICIIKDVVLNRCKAYNTAQLLVFMVEIFDSYMRQRLVDVALCRQQVKSISSEKTRPYVVKSTGEGLYTVQSQSDQLQYYHVDLTIGMCTCVQGQNGAICKHQIASADYGMTVVPQIFVSTSRNRQWLAALAVGKEHVPKMSFFKGLTEVTENETNESTESDVDVKINAGQFENVKTESFPEDSTDDDYDLSADSTIVAEALKEKTVELGDADTRMALQRYLQRVQSLKTTNQLNTFLNSAGSVSIRHGGAGCGKIPCQPTSIARRSTGMPRGAAPIGKGRRPAAALSSKPKRQKEMSQKPDRWQLHPDAIPSVALLPSRPKHGAPVGLGLQSSPVTPTGGSDNTTDVLFTTPKGRPKRNAAAKRERKRDEVEASRAGAVYASSPATVPGGSGQESTYGRIQEFIGPNHSRKIEVKSEPRFSGEFWDGNEPEVYIDVAEHPEDSRKRRHSIGDCKEFFSVSDERKYIKCEDDNDQKIDISQEFAFVDTYEKQDPLKGGSEVEGTNLDGIKQEPDGDGILSIKEEII